MRRTGRAIALAGALLLLAVPSALHASELGFGTPGPQTEERGSWRSQQWLIPLRGERLLMHATVMRPPGDGPFPLAVINHGSAQSSYERGRTDPSRYELLSRWFLERGYAVVLPIRGGHGATNGPYFEDQGLCANPDYERAGLAVADSTEAAPDYLTAEPFVGKTGVVVVGHSAGGWGALALAGRSPAKVRVVVNVAGGRGAHADGVAGRNCAPERLVAAAHVFGKSAKIPTLWLYAENDSHFPPALSGRMAEAFRSAGGGAQFHLLQRPSEEGHAFIEDPAAEVVWSPLLQKFLDQNR